jgi:predicted transcriptional regulator YdeE
MGGPARAALFRPPVYPQGAGIMSRSFEAWEAIENARWHRFVDFRFAYSCFVCGRSRRAKTYPSERIFGYRYLRARQQRQGNDERRRHWQTMAEIVQEGVLQQIPNKVDSNIYAVYSDYASDKNGEYSLTIGARVPDGSAVPAGLVLKTVHAGSYAVVTSDQGPVAKVVVAAWQRVWEMEDKHALGGARAYRTDYEFYDQRAANPQDSQVDLYIGLK